MDVVARPSWRVLSSTGLRDFCDCEWIDLLPLAILQLGFQGWRSAARIILFRCGMLFEKVNLRLPQAGILRFGPYEHMPYLATLATDFSFGGEVRIFVIGSDA